MIPRVYSWNKARRVTGPNPPHFLHVFPSFGQGGVPLRIVSILNDLGSTYRHSIIALDGCFDSRRRLDDAVSAEFLDPQIEKANPFRALGTVFRTLRSIRPDLLLTYNWGSIEWAAVNRFCPIATHLHLESGFGKEEAAAQLPRRVRARRIALARTYRLIVPSESLLHLATEIWRIESRRIALIPNGVDCERYASVPDRAVVPGIERAQGAIIVGTVAPLRPEKNLSRLVRSFAAVGPQRDAFLVIAGDGTERPMLEALARNLGIGERVIFAGHVERPERVYGLMDVFAMSSDTEQMPNSLIQAMAAARPVVATDVGDVRPILAAENKPFAVPAGDEASFQAALARLIDDADLRATLGKQNQRRAREVYPQAKMFAAYRALFAEACHIAQGRSA